MPEDEKKKVFHQASDCKIAVLNAAVRKFCETVKAPTTLEKMVLIQDLIAGRELVGIGPSGFPRMHRKKVDLRRLIQAREHPSC